MPDIDIHRIPEGPIAEVTYSFLSVDDTENVVILSEGEVVIQTAVSSVTTFVKDLPALILALEHARDEALDQYVYTQKNGVAA